MLSAAEAIEHLVGLQAQAPLAPYVALWSRLAGFDAEELAALLRERRAVRTHAMRTTIHLLTARDCLALRPLMQAVVAADFRTTPFARAVAGIDPDVLAAAGRALLEARPYSRVALGRALAERWPDRDPGSLATAVCHLVPAVQVTPRGVWGERGPIAWTTIERWLGDELPEDPPPADEAVLRYLAAFGPASVPDMRAWSRLAGLRAVADRLRPMLRAFRDERGRELLDLPDAPRPDPDTPAPPRFLPEYDNVLLSHHDRTRINDRGRPIPLAPGNGAAMGTFLVDGFLRGTWRIVREGDRALLRLAPDEPLARGAADALAAEGEGLLAFAAPDARDRDVALPGATPASRTRR